MTTRARNGNAPSDCVVRRGVNLTEHVLVGWWVGALCSFVLLALAIDRLPVPRLAGLLTLVPGNVMIAPLAIELTRLALCGRRAHGFEEGLAPIAFLGMLAGVIGLFVSLGAAPPWRAPWLVNLARLTLAITGTLGAGLMLEIAAEI